MKLIDVHKHVDALETFNGEAIINFNYYEKSLKLNPSNCYSLALHPKDIPQDINSVLKTMEHLLQKHQNIIAIGEVGLDKYVTSPLPLQVELFKSLALLAEKYKRPLIIHNVKTTEELLKIKKEIDPQMAWVLHGFRGKKEMMQQLVRHHFYLSFGKYYNEKSLENMPLEQMFIETDEEKITTQEVIKKISRIKVLEEEKLTQQLKANIEKVFFNS